MKLVFTLKNMLTFSRSCKLFALVAALSFMGLYTKAQTVYALSGSSLVSFSPTAPGTVTTVGTVTGIATGQTVEGMDFRPATGQLFALGYNTSSGLGQLYIVNLKSAVATPVGTGATLATGLTNIGFDFNPTVDRIRVVAGALNYRMNPLTGGLVQPDGNLNYTSGGNTPNAVAAAYTNSYLGTGTTTMYVYDYANNTIAASTNPNAGTLTPGGSSTITPASAVGIDLDISYTAATGVNSAYLLATVGAGSGLYTVNLATGAATAVGAIGVSNVTEMAVYFPPIPVSKIVYALAGNSLIAFNSATPATVKTVGTISGLATGLSLVGMDFRPATGQLFALGYQASSGSAQIYTVDTTTAALTAVGGSQILAIGMTRVGFDFNPVPDRIRVTASGGQNYRMNPIDGSITATDGNLNYPTGDANAGQTPGVATVAYSNSIAGTTSTIMYAYDATYNRLDSSYTPNVGTLRTLATLNITPTNADSVDMDISFNNTNGSNFALLAASGTLYNLNLATGVIGSLGTIGANLAVSDIAIYIAPPTQARLAYAISGSNLVSFNSATPATVTTIGNIANVAAGQTLVGLDFRPANNGLYAFGYSTNTGVGQVYTISTSTGAATAVGSAITTLPVGMMNIGFDFNPTVDRIRLTSSTGQNYRLNPNDGTVAATDGNLAYSTTTSDVNSGVVPTVAAAGYTNSFSTNFGGTTTLYYYDYGTDAIATTSAPNVGTLNTIGNSGIMTSTATGLDMDILYNGTINTAFVSATVAGTANPNLYTVNTRTGELRLVGTIGAPITEMAFVNFDPLPIALVDFTGRKVGNSSELSWATQSESNNSHFIIERSSNGTSFTAVSGNINSKAPNGNSAQRLSYTFTDDAPAKGTNFYRLVQVDRDSKTTVSKTVQLRFDGGYNISLYPNPTISTIHLNGYQAEKADLQIRLNDMTGKTISNTVLKGQSGNWSTQLPAERLAAGTYYVSVLKDNMVIYTQAVQKK